MSEWPIYRAQAARIAADTVDLLHEATMQARNTVGALVITAGVRICSPRTGARIELKIRGGGSDELYARAQWPKDIDLMTGLVPAPKLRTRREEGQ